MRKLNLSIISLCMFTILLAPCNSFASDSPEKTVKDALITKDWDKVIETAHTWKEQNKATPVPYLALAYAYYVKDDYQKVSQSLGVVDSQEKKEALLAWTEKFAQKYPQNSIPYLLKGDAYIRLKKYNEAIKEFDKAEKLDPSFFLVYVEKGMVYGLQGNYDEAIKNFTRAIELELKSADAYNNRGIAYFSKGDYKLALDDFNQAIKIKPEFGLAYLGRGKVYHSLVKDDLSLADFQKAEEINRKGINTFFNRKIDPGTGKANLQIGGSIQIPISPFPDISAKAGNKEIAVKFPPVGGIEAKPEGKIVKTEEGEKVSEKALGDKFVTSALSFLLYNGQFLSKAGGERGK